MSFADAVKTAEAYDAWIERGWGSYAFRVESRALLRAAGPVAGLRVLDVGSGTGRFSEELRLHGAEVLGPDQDAAMLRVAKNKYSSPSSWVMQRTCHSPTNHSTS